MKTQSNSSKSSDTLEAIKHRFVTSPIHNFLPLEVEGFDALVGQTNSDDTMVEEI